MGDIRLKSNVEKNIYDVNVFEYCEKPLLEECYICLESIGNEPNNGAIHPYRCRHHVCALCFNRLCKNNFSCKETFVKCSTCGICRAIVNQYIIGPEVLCQTAYSQFQTIYVPEQTLNKNTMFRDHLQHILAHANVSDNQKMFGFM